MKLICFADLHAHIYREFDEKSDITGSERLDHIVNTLQTIRRYAVDNVIKYVLFAGDLFHVRGKVDTVVFNAIYDEIKRFSEDGIEVILIAGNHDQKDNSDVPPHSLHAFADIPNVWVYGDMALHMIGSPEERVDIYCAPFSKNTQRTKDWIKGLELKQQTGTGHVVSSILLFHAGVTGGLTGKGSYAMEDAFTVEDFRPTEFKYVIGGHYHRRQFLGGHQNMFYCGAPIQHSFNDEGEDKGFYVVDTSKRCDVQFVSIPNPKFHTVDLFAVANEDMEAVASDGSYVRLQVTEAELPIAKTYLPPNLKYKVDLQKEYKEETRIDVKVGMSPDEVVKKYAEEYDKKDELDALRYGLMILKDVTQGGL